MIRITKTFEDTTTVTLRLDGTVVRATLSELKKLCRHYPGNDKKEIVLDFSGVTFIDNSGLKMLQKIQEKRVKLTNGSPFIRALLRGLPAKT